MAGPQDIQRVPRGLIDLLGMRATGQTPAQLGGDIRGSLELLEFYLNERTRVLQGTSGTIVAPGISVVTGSTVPQGQLWLLFQISLSSGLSAAGQGAILTGGVLRNPSGINPYFALTDPFTWGAVQAVGTGKTFARPVIMQPGDQLAIRTSAILTAAPAIAVTVDAYYAPLLI
jgi:hypothetical protein